MPRSKRRILFIVLICLATPGWQGAPAAKPDALLRQFCQDCHGQGSEEGGFSLPPLGSDWGDAKNLDAWERIEQMVSKGIMPPSDAEPLTVSQRVELLNWIDEKLIRHSPLGGTGLRRLSGREFRNTIADVFGMPDYQLPLGFPPETPGHGFDNQAESLVMAASHLESFSQAASAIADGIFPPERPPADSRQVEVPAEDLVISYSSACLIDGAMRLASSGANEVRHATWPTKFEAPVSGRYRVEVIAHSLDPRPGTHQPELLVSSTKCSGDGIASSQTVTVPAGEAVAATFEIGIDKGETIKLRYSNGPFDYDEKPVLAEFLEVLFLEEPSLAAAWKKLGKPARGGSGWQRLKETMGRKDLDTAPFEQPGASLDALVKSVAANAVNTGETLVYKYFEEGPYVAIESVRIVGPIQEYADGDQQRLARQRASFLGDAEGQDDTVTLTAFFDRFLTKLFRRPATESEVAAYVGLVQQEAKAQDSFDDGMHLALRTALISPAFLYRCVGQGELTEYDLASRLSYFLASSPPDETLMKLAAEGKLSESKVLRQQTHRLLKNSQSFAIDFTRQWLALDRLDQLMPDSRLIKKFTADHRRGMGDEVVMTFREILDHNLPIRQFVSPDFVFTNEAVGRDIYRLPQFSGKKQKRAGRTKLKRVPVDSVGRVGGLLAMPAVMMATANGVDTQPVLRGVWMLENVLGAPPPDPPKAVPALTPDTSGASSPRERLNAHMAEASCAACHREIDPLGFVLENFDPIGRWRDHYPRYVERNGKIRSLDGPLIDASGVLPDGVPIEDVTDLKAWLSEHPEPLARCLGEKLMVYATGRQLNYRERKLIHGLVEQNLNRGLPFKEFILDLVDSDVFRAK